MRGRGRGRGGGVATCGEYCIGAPICAEEYVGVAICGAVHVSCGHCLPSSSYACNSRVDPADQCGIVLRPLHLRAEHNAAMTASSTPSSCSCRIACSVSTRTPVGCSVLTALFCANQRARTPPHPHSFVNRLPLGYSSCPEQLKHACMAQTSKGLYIKCPSLCAADMLGPDAKPSSIEWVIVKGGGEATIPITEAYSLTALLTPTPRWPDAMCVVDPISKVVFTSKLFSAHVAPGLLNSKVSVGHEF